MSNNSFNEVLEIIKNRLLCVNRQNLDIIEQENNVDKLNTKYQEISDRIKSIEDILNINSLTEINQPTKNDHNKSLDSKLCDLDLKINKLIDSCENNKEISDNNINENKNKLQSIIQDISELKKKLTTLDNESWCNVTL